MTTTQVEQSWKDLVLQAQAIYPPFANEKVIMTVLKSRGETTFKPEYSNKFINLLKSIVNDWKTFLLDAREIDTEFDNEKTVTKILNTRGIPWYDDFDITNGLNALRVWQTENHKSLNHWDYPCPICGEVTIRDAKFDYLYRRECNGLSWRCSIGGYTHYIQAVWNPLRKKFVFQQHETTVLVKNS